MIVIIPSTMNFWAILKMKNYNFNFNKMNEKGVVISLEDFEIPFVNSINEKFEEEAPDKEDITDNIPESAVFLGEINLDVDSAVSGVTWDVEEEYYIMPWNDGDFDWALFRVYYDDNEDLWSVNPDARISGGIKSYKEAAILMLRDLFKSWGINIDDPEYEDYKEFLEEIKQMKD